MRRSKVYTPSLVLLAAMAASGCSAASENGAATPSPESVSSPDTASNSSPGTPADEPLSPSGTPTPEARATGGPLDAVSAIETALGVLPGDVVAGGRTSDEGTRVWYVTVRGDGRTGGTEIYLNLSTGEVVKQQPEVLQPAARGPLPPISAQQALDTALGSVPGASVVEFDLDREDGIRAWYVFLRSDTSGQREVYIDAESGDVLSTGRG